MKHRIDPTVDCVFKALLGNEKHKNLLIHFLNAVLEPPDNERISEVVIIDPYNEREFETDKLSIVDVKAKDGAGNNYQIEIQAMVHAGLPARILYTWSTIYHSLIGRGESYSLLKPVISIWLLKNSLFEETDDFHLPFAAWNVKNGITLSRHFGVHLLQLPKWKMSDAACTEKDRWLYLFREGGNPDADSPPEILNTEEMRQAMAVIKDFSENQKNYLRYQSRLEAEFERNTLYAELEKALKKAEQAQKEKEETRKEKEAALKKAEQAQKEKEETRKEKEAALKKAEQALNEAERLLLLLKKAGIDPGQS